MQTKSPIYAALSLIFSAILVFTEFGHSGLLAILYNGFAYIGVFFHEIGHTIFAWLFGIPAFPIFDFKYGGGYSLQIATRSWMGQVIVWGGMGYGLYWAKENITENMRPLLLPPLIIFCGVVVLIGLTDFYEDVILFMGHGTQAIIGGFLLARGFFAIFLTRPSERWLNVIIGAFLIFEQLHFCNLLLHDTATQMDYEGQKGSHGFGDLSRIAGNHASWTQNGVTKFLWFWTALMAVSIPFASYLLVRSVRSNKLGAEQ